MFGGFAGTLSEEMGRVSGALDFARLSAQYAPSGHPIYAAISNAEHEAEYIRRLIPFYSSGNEPAPSHVVRQADDAVDRIYDAAADIRTDPSAPLPPTIWQQVKALPWGWIGAATLVAAGGFAYFKGHRR